MIDTSDAFAEQLLDEARRFLEKACTESDADGVQAYLHAALLLGYGALEAFINSIAEDFQTRTDLSLHEQGLLREREVTLKDGNFELTEKLRMFRIEDRIEFLHRRFSGEAIDKTAALWAKTKAGLELRNAIMHPRTPRSISKDSVSTALDGIIGIIDLICRAVYKRGYPPKSRGLASRLQF